MSGDEKTARKDVGDQGRCAGRVEGPRREFVLGLGRDGVMEGSMGGLGK